MTQVLSLHDSTHPQGEGVAEFLEGMGLKSADWQASFTVISLALDVLCSQLPETSDLVERSTEELSTRFMQLAEGSHDQGERVQTIADAAKFLELNDGERVSLQDFTRLFTTTLYDAIDKILLVSRKAMEMVYTLDDAIKSLGQIAGFIKEIQKINRQANLLALNAAIEANRVGKAGESFQVVAQEVKLMSNNIRTLSSEMQEKIHVITNSVSNGYDLLRDVATTDMSSNLQAKEKLDQLMTCMMKQNAHFTHLLQETAEYSHHMSNNISNMIVGMQFQDRNKQYVQNSVSILHYLSEMFVQLKHPDSLPSAEKLSHDLNAKFTLSEFTHIMAQSLHKHGFSPPPPVMQTALADAAGDDIELF